MVRPSFLLRLHPGLRAVLGAALLAAAGAASAADAHTVTLVAKDGRFEPATLEAPAGTRIRIEIENAGDTPIEFESTPLRKEKVLAPGARSVVVIQPLDPGRYPFFDEFHPDTGRGELIVR